MDIIIGGVNRRIDQVDTYLEYIELNGGDSVGEILTKSRADRLVRKVQQNVGSKQMVEIATGEADFIEVPEVDYPEDVMELRGGDAVDMARELEYSFAQQASAMYENY
jgi:hypothetical protein